MTESGGQEVYSSGPSKAAAPVQNQPRAAVAAPAPRPTLVEEEDDLSIPVSAGTACKHTGCSVAFVSDEVNRLGDGEGTVCTYHPQSVSPAHLLGAPQVLTGSFSPSSMKGAKYVFVAQLVPQLIRASRDTSVVNAVCWNSTSL